MAAPRMAQRAKHEEENRENEIDDGDGEIAVEILEDGEAAGTIIICDLLPTRTKSCLPFIPLYNLSLGEIESLELTAGEAEFSEGEGEIEDESEDDGENEDSGGQGTTEGKEKSKIFNKGDKANKRGTTEDSRMIIDVEEDEAATQLVQATDLPEAHHPLSQAALLFIPVNLLTFFLQEGQEEGQPDQLTQLYPSLDLNINDHLSLVSIQCVTITFIVPFCINCIYPSRRRYWNMQRSKETA